MSMKRARRVNSPAKQSQTEGSFAFGNAPTPKSWAETVKDKPDDIFKPYSLGSTFARDDLVMHPKFGKGVVTMVDGAKVEILFEEGAKKLGHAAG